VSREDALVRRAIERPHGGLRHAAGTAAGRTRKQPQPRCAIGLAVGAEDVAPHVLGGADHGGDEIALVIGWRALLCRRRLTLSLLLGRPLNDFSAADQDARVDAEKPAD
jgi:hypothetical protein